MRMSKKAEYACRAMLELAASYAAPQPVRVKAIAQAHSIPERFLMQILLHLKTAGLVASVRGAAGGYQLARAPEAISLAAILGAIEDRTPSPRPRPGPRRGKRVKPTEPDDSPAARTLSAIWKEIQAAEQRLLQNISLAELLRRSQQGAELSYQI